MRSKHAFWTVMVFPVLLLGARPLAPMRRVSALQGALVFAVPASWHVLRESDSDSLGVFVYHVRDPAVDSTTQDRTNIVVNIHRRIGTRAFRAYTDSMLGGLMEPSMAVLQDTVVGTTQRAVFWRGQLKTTPYVGFDDFGRVGNVWVHVRIVFPLTVKSSLDRQNQLSDETRRLLESVRAGKRAVFPSSLGYPTLASFGN